jgi:tRNA dimethylallyltransferase
VPTIPVIFVVGPTASGKTAVSYELAKLIGGQVINADVGQFYQPLRVGTAKPAWQDHVIKAHLFDVCTQPEDFTVVQYRTLVLSKIRELQAKGIVPIVAGGSFFYVSSLFFPPKDLVVQAVASREVQEFSWQTLARIDPVRAAQIHPNDSYRINRALAIWEQTGVLPSQLQPEFNFNDPVYVIGLTPERPVLCKRIAERTIQMLEVEGWIEEAMPFLDSPWESFIRRKGLLGYDLIFDALRDGKATPSLLAAKIIQQTEQYAKRQLTFFRGFVKKMLAIHQQKKTIILQRSPDHTAISYEHVARLVAYLQK